MRRRIGRRATMTDRKAVIKNADMSEEMQQDAVECATQALEKYNIEKDIAAFIKKEFDKKFNPTWHCIVGRNFGSYVTHETKHFIYFYLGQVAILLFKSDLSLLVTGLPQPRLLEVGIGHGLGDLHTRYVDLGVGGDDKLLVGPTQGDSVQGKRT
ncbi:Dynein light chain 2, cytoplasmic [Merluccius polli]|uniref:Dynein light chain n=1 Tax=Merluccius polli TaxID=89951 RepID=A0AA47P9P8_MERPO|nr:Dynein light chain 2, cytoplasmic [Merluccius polli]